MTVLSVPLPDTLKQWAESRVAQGRYVDAGDYVRDLLRRDQEREEKLEQLLAALDEGLSSPEVDSTIEDIISERRQARAAE
jgi:antitoxin ParD1/3/4